MGNLGGPIFLGLVVLFIWWSWNQGRSGVIGFEARRAPKEVTIAALQTFSQQGWVTTSQTDQSISFSRTQAPGCLITGFLLLFGIIPGLLYWIAAKRTLTVSVSAHPSSAAGNSLVSIAWSRNGGGRGPSLRFKEMLAPGAAVMVAQGPRTSLIAEQIEDATGGALSGHELARQAEVPAPPALPLPAAPVCARCARTDLADHEFARTPVLCDRCLDELR